MFDGSGSGELENSDFLSLLLSAIVKKSGGKLSVSTTDIASIEMNECLILLFDANTKEFSLRIATADESIVKLKPPKPTIH